MRIVIDVRKDANPQVVLNQLYQYTQLQDTVGVIMLAIDHKVPKVMTLKQMIQKYVEFQDEVVRRRTQYDLKKARERAHILEGLKKATDIVDELIATIRACKGGMSEAKAAIMEQFGFDDPQADAIVKLQLGRLAGLEILKIEEELGSLNAKIRDWEEILADDARVLEIVKSELLEMKRRFGDDRRTEIETVTGEVDIEDLIAEEQCVYTLTEAGYIKRQLKATYQAQKRGGRGISGMTRKEEDIVQEMFVGSTHDYVLFVTDKGRLFRIKGYTIAEGSRTSKGTNIVNLLQLAEGEKGHQYALPEQGYDQRRRFCDHGHKAGPHQAHPAGAVCKHPQVRPDRHCPERGGCTGLDKTDLRPRYAHRCNPQRSGHPLQ